MRTATTRFLDYLRVERNASELTIKSYREDLEALSDYLTECHEGSCPRPDQVAVLDLRGYVAGLHEAGYALAIGSSGAPANIEVVLDCLPNAEMFAATVNGFEVTEGKPDPEIFLTAAGKLGVEPRNAAVIEDSPVGIEAAKAAGMVAVAVTGTAERSRLAEANIIVDWMMELSPQLISLLIENHRRKA